MTCNASFGHQGKLVFALGEGTPSDWSVSSRSFDFRSSTLAKHGRRVFADGIRGTRSPHIDRLRDATYYVSGEVVIDVSPSDLEYLLPLIMGTGPALLEDVPYFACMMDTDADVFKFTDLKVNGAVLSGRAPRLNESSSPDLMTLSLQLVGKTFTSGQTYPAAAPEITTGSATQPYILADATISIESANREVVSFAFLVRNGLATRFVNSLTATNICPGTTRFVGARLVHPWNADHDDLLDISINTGNTATFTFTNGGMSTAFTMVALDTANQPSPTIRHKGEIFLQRDYRAYAKGTVGVDYNKELTVVNDATP